VRAAHQITKRRWSNPNLESVERDRYYCSGSTFAFELLFQAGPHLHPLPEGEDRYVSHGFCAGHCELSAFIGPLTFAHED
jgi:hypothetical protein